MISNPSMFRPKEKKKHSLPVFEALTADEAARSLLFSPLDLASGLRLSDRTWVPAMVPWRATEEGFVTKEVLAWYERFAEHMELAPMDFAMSYIMRSGRIDIERLRKLSPGFVARYERER